MERQEFIDLVSAEGRSLLGAVTYDSKTDVVKLVSKLRSEGHSPGLVAAVLSQAKLRRRAEAKFGEFAERMLFTEAGLEQASRLSVSAQHAARFAGAGIAHLADLGCGIGSESMAFASMGIRVTAYDIDEVTAAVATHNLLPFENADVRLGDVTQTDLAEYDALFFDPARRELNGPKRAAATRKFNPDEFSPNYSWVIEACSNPKLKAAGLKLGPGHPHDEIPDNCEAQWVSVGGDLVELGLWFGAAARTGIQRSALLLTTDGRHELTTSSIAGEPAPLGDIDAFVFEPDNSVVRSHLIGVLANQLGLRSFSPGIAYLTGPKKIASPWLKGYEVIEVMPFDRKRLKQRLQQMDVGILEIKKRGSDVVPEQLRKELNLKGKGSITLIVTRLGEQHRVILAQPAG